jgi:alpha-glucosidase
MLLLTLRGTPTLYYGDEIGMHQVTVAPHEVRDPFEKNVPGIGVGRDGCRTPMQWNATDNAGFSSAKPWLPLASDYMRENVAALEADPRSILALYRALIALRKKSPQLVQGAYQPIAAEDDILLYRREGDGGALVIALNLGAKPASIASNSFGSGREILLSTFLDRPGEVVEDMLDLRANEGVILGGTGHAG